jgi:hypothetical protein
VGMGVVEEMASTMVRRRRSHVKVAV